MNKTYFKYLSLGIINIKSTYKPTNPNTINIMRINVTEIPNDFDNPLQTPNKILLEFDFEKFIL